MADHLLIQDQWCFLVFFTGFSTIACIWLYRTLYCRREAAVSHKLSSSGEKIMVRLSSHHSLTWYRIVVIFFESWAFGVFL